MMGWDGMGMRRREARGWPGLAEPIKQDWKICYFLLDGAIFVRSGFPRQQATRMYERTYAWRLTTYCVYNLYMGSDGMCDTQVYVVVPRIYKINKELSGEKVNTFLKINGLVVSTDVSTYCFRGNHNFRTRSLEILILMFGIFSITNSILHSGQFVKRSTIISNCELWIFNLSRVEEGHDIRHDRQPNEEQHVKPNRSAVLKADSRRCTNQSNTQRRLHKTQRGIYMCVFTP